MADVFARIWGQPRVRDFLRSAFESDLLSHAYLLTGPAGSGKTSAAFSIAAAILCGCGECDTCTRVFNRKHPDVHFVAPDGNQAYLVSQVRDIVNDASLAPIQAKRKVYILNRADFLNSASANALLKTLEEPPFSVTFILLARTPDAVLPTIVSRCSHIPFAAISESNSAGIVEQNAGVTNERARKALAACDGSVESAVEFSKNNKNFNQMQELLSALSSMGTADELDMLKLTRKILTFADAPLDDIKLSQAKYLDDNSEFLNASAVRELKKRNERALKTATRDALLLELSIIKSWLTDLMYICSSCPDKVVHTDIINSLNEASVSTSIDCVVRAIDKIEVAKQALSQNVSPQTCTDALLIDIRKALYD